jgi:peptidoglycan/LPS O-acetylase OafA/YrhL
MTGKEDTPGVSGTPQHIPALDGLRAIAILLVIPHNVYVFESTRGWLAPFAWLATAGWIGVQLFFVLSGFLITRNLLDSRGASNYYSAFFGRRILRIFPLYFVVLAFFLLVLPELVHLSANVRSSYANQKWLWLFLSNWAQPFGKEVYWFPHFWSLAVEEQFYLLWPLIIAGTPTRRLIPVCLTLIIAALVIRVAMLEAGATPEMLYMFTVCRMDALAIGALAAVLVGIPEFMTIVRKHATLLLAAALFLFGVGASFTHSYNVYDGGSLTMGQTTLALSITTVLLTVVAGSESRVATWLSATLRLPPLRSVGKFSYAMYVFHIPLTNLIGAPLLPSIKRLGSGYPVWYAIWIAVCSYLAAVASYHLLEKHFLRAKRYFVPAKTSDSRIATTSVRSSR